MVVSWKTRAFWPCCSDGSGALWQCIVGKKRRDRTGRAEEPGHRNWLDDGGSGIGCGLVNGLSLKSSVLAAFGDVDGFFKWRSYSAGGRRNAVGTIELEAETQIMDRYRQRQWTCRCATRLKWLKKIVALWSPISRALNLLLVPTDILDTLLFFYLRIIYLKSSGCSQAFAF